MVGTQKDPPTTLWESLLALPPMLQFARCSHSSPQTVLAAARLATRSIKLTACKPAAPATPFNNQGYLSYVAGDGVEIMYIKPEHPVAIKPLSAATEYLCLTPASGCDTGNARLTAFASPLELPQQHTGGFTIVGVAKQLLGAQALASLLANHHGLSRGVPCCIHHLFKDLHIAPDLSAATHAVRHFEKRLIRLLNQQYCPFPAICGAYAISASGETTSLERAIQFMHDQPDWKYSLPMLARQANSGERSLYYQFKHYTGTSPYRFYLKNRLFAARAQMISEHGHNETIAYHAVNAGFFHLSRFSSLYKAVLGELPSDTKARRAELARLSKARKS